VEITVVWDDKSSTLVEGYRRYVAFVYLYETAHSHMTEGGNLYRRIMNDVMSILSTKINGKTVVCYLTVIYMCLLLYMHSDTTLFHFLLI
jgi:hypothetical protein